MSEHATRKSGFAFYPPDPLLRERCLRFQAAWRDSPPPRIEDFLDGLSDHQQGALLRSLIRLEIRQRRGQGDQPRTDDYSPRFAQLDLDWLAREIASLPGDAAPLGRTLAWLDLTHEHRDDFSTPAKPILCCPHCRQPVPLAEQRSCDLICSACGGTFRVEPPPLLTTQDQFRILGRFQLLERVGQGAFGEVWRARDQELQRIVALKIPRPSLVDSSSSGDRIQREARAAAQLRHPNIVRLYEVETFEGTPILVSDFIEGVSLRELLEVQTLTFSETAGLLAEVADALDYAHRMGLIHRDLKPGNIMVEYGRSNHQAGQPPAPDGRQDPPAGRIGKPIVVDFGLALRQEAEEVVTVDGQILGTPAYMSPEQAAGRSHQVDRRSDVYSLGVILYQLLTGQLPHRGSKAMLIHQVLREEPRPPRTVFDKIPRDLETICLKALAKEPAQRYDTARALADDLRRFLRGEPIQARPVGQFERSWRWCRRNPLIASLGSLAVFLLLAGTVVSTYFGFRAARGEREANQHAAIAEQEKQLSDRRRYGAQVYLAQQAWNNGQLPLMQDLLAAQEPKEGERDLRGFEYHYLRRLLRSELLTIPVPGATVQSLAFSPDGRWLAYPAADHTVRIWDLGTGKEQRTLYGPTQPVQCVAFSPDGRRLASSGKKYDADMNPMPGEVFVWDLATGQKDLVLRDQDGPVMALAFSPNNRELACAGAGPGKEGSPSPGKIVIWDRESGKKKCTLSRHERRVFGLAYSGDGRRLASVGEDGQVVIWEPSREKPLVRAFKADTFPPLFCVTFRPDGQQVAFGGWDQTVMLWDLEAENSSPTILGRHLGPIQGLAYSLDSRRLASASRDHLIKIWNPTTKRETATLRGHADAVYCVAFSPDGWRLASGGADQVVKVWGLNASEPDCCWCDPGDPIYSLAFSPDGRQLALAGNDRTVKLWDATLGLLARCLRGHSRLVRSVAFSPDGKLLASAGKDCAIRLWDAATGEERQTLTGHGEPVSWIAFSPDGKLLASAGYDQTVRIWDLAAYKELAALTGHHGAVRTVAFSPDGRFLASGGDDGELKLWDVTGHKELRTVGKLDAAVWCVAFSPDGRTLASGGQEPTIHLWDLGKKGDSPLDLGGQSPFFSEEKSPLRLRGHSKGVLSVAFNQDGSRLASGSVDQTVKIWDTQTGQALLSLSDEKPVYSVAFCPDGWRLASAGHSGEVKLWDATPWTAALQDRLEARRLVDFLFAKSLSRDQILSSLRQDQTIQEPVRRAALDLVEPYWQSRIREQANDLINSLGEKSLLKKEIVQAIQTKANLEEAVRVEALAQASQFVEDPKELSLASRKLVLQPGQDTAAYERAQRLAQQACQLAPGDGHYHALLGMAQFRLGNYQEAVTTLTLAAQFRGTPPQPVELAFLAMAQSKNGQEKEAQATLQRLKQTMQQAQLAKQGEAQALLHEAEELLAGKANGVRKYTPRGQK